MIIFSLKEMWDVVIDAFIKDFKTSIEQCAGDRLVRMVLFGSRARADWTEDSDIDVAIIVKDLDSRLKDRILDAIADVELKHLTPMSALVISERDFELLKRRERRIALDIEKEGIPL